MIEVLVRRQISVFSKISNYSFKAEDSFIIYSILHYLLWEILQKTLGHSLKFYYILYTVDSGNRYYTVKCILLSAQGFHNKSSLFLCSSPWNILWSYNQHKKDDIAPVGHDRSWEMRGIQRQIMSLLQKTGGWKKWTHNPLSYLSLWSVLLTNCLCCFINWYSPYKWATMHFVALHSSLNSI